MIEQGSIYRNAFWAAVTILTFLNVYTDKQTHEKMDRDKVDFVAQVRHLVKEQ